MTETYKRASTSDEVKTATVRWEPTVYTQLRSYAQTQNTSMTLALNQIVGSFLAQPDVNSSTFGSVTYDSDEIEAAVRKLSGEES